MKRNKIVALISGAIALPLLALSLYPTISQAAVTPPNGSLTIIQHVINDGGGTLVAADFPISVTLDAANLPIAAPGLESPGRTYSLAPGVYEISQPVNVAYTSTFSGLSYLGDTVTATSTAQTVSNTSIVQTITVSSLRTSVATITNNDINLGTLHVVKNVINRYTGTKVAGDFIMHVKLNGVDVAGSPAAGVGGAGRTYRLLPGNYAVQEDDAAGYFGNFDGPDLSNGYVTIVSDQEVTVSRTNYDMFDRTAVTPTTPPVVTPPVTPAPTPTGTVTGGVLPKTGTPWNNLLALGAGLILVGAVGFTSRKVRGHLTR
jgi:LPXTG-motif cell wall-anchored protein